MSIVPTVVAPTSSIVAASSPSTNPGASKGSEATANQPGNAGTSAATGQAAVVNFSASGKTRPASSGESRTVDASFEKQEVKKEKEEQGKGGSGNGLGKSVDVAA